MGDGLDESLRRGNFIGKSEAQNSARDCLDVEDGSESLQCSKEFMFFQRRRGLEIDN